MCAFIQMRSSKLNFIFTQTLIFYFFQYPCSKPEISVKKLSTIIISHTRATFSRGIRHCDRAHVVKYEHYFTCHFFHFSGLCNNNSFWRVPILNVHIIKRLLCTAISLWSRKLNYGLTKVAAKIARISRETFSRTGLLFSGLLYLQDPFVWVVDTRPEENVRNMKLFGSCDT